MITSVEDLRAQNILKVLDEHGEALKKTGGRLTRLEEPKLKKPLHVEIHVRTYVFHMIKNICRDFM